MIKALIAQVLISVTTTVTAGKLIDWSIIAPTLARTQPPRSLLPGVTEVIIGNTVTNPAALATLEGTIGIYRGGRRALGIWSRETPVQPEVIAHRLSESINVDGSLDVSQEIIARAVDSAINPGSHIMRDRAVACIAILGGLILALSSKWFLYHWTSGKVAGFVRPTHPLGTYPQLPQHITPIPPVNQVAGNGGGSVILAITSRNVGYYVGGVLFIVFVLLIVYIQHRQYQELLLRFSLYERSQQLPSPQAKPNSGKQ